MDATRPTRVGFDPRVDRIRSHTVAAFDSFRFPPDFNHLLHCTVVVWTPHVRRESGSIPVLIAFAHIPLPLSTPSVFSRLLRCAVVGWTPHVRQESGSFRVLSAFAHMRLPLSTPSVFRPDFNSLLRCAVVGRTPHVRRESGSIPVLSAFAHIRLPLSTPSVFARILSSTPTVPLSDGRHTSDESRVRSPC
ncbi:hypothetical protein KIN20_036628 [Parelaphostrongylus tenuis]|uniref:Uncharacterized protein n=1 Tax=Parelaphostrongylus tenuis TaxID=148309 RepID=A0AAD5RDB0_PARTN|nr:hypothetical protein KIN20_036628 [Parelaphostrongylus tenuis]